ncbi:putative GAF sensor protein [Magnetococcus marinus MC-1]|uniref:Putative GAF sensor protein n=1 Tax=Magnetococcus marinus (strain ATCC BAA-1437 / JCM 17883 / MC-1) TaxID=156889 RepID=A0L461_MAGMM|nr:GAF domain-containing protein [Magnetococcus marinus]ABK42754.1 putative GAF sensor protein [Magnetococcus marinus MC-1]
MDDTRLPLRPFTTHKLIKGITYPEAVSFRDLVVTGPPGSGKSTLIAYLDGWSEEGVVDLTQKGWWKQPVLHMRPREVHFLIPFVGFERAVPVYELKSLDHPDFLEIDLFRLVLPPRKQGPLATDFRNRFLFEFLLPDAEVMYQRRQQRAKARSHTVEEDLSLAQVRLELSIYQQLAQFMHQEGMRVLVRTEVDAPPMVIDSPQCATQPINKLSAQELLQTLDKVQLRQRVFNRSWNERSNRDLMALFVEMVPTILQVEECAIFIRQQDSEALWLVSSNAEEKTTARCKSQKSLGCDLVSQVIHTGLHQVFELGEGQQKPAQDGELEMRNALCVPIPHLSRAGASGAILVRNTTDGRAFRAEDRNFLERLAQHLQTASETLFLRRQLSNFSELLGQKVETTQWLRMIIALLSMLVLAETALLMILH